MNGIREDLSQDDVMELLIYDPATGVLSWKPRPLEMFESERVWKIWNRRYANKEAGNIHPTSGYRKVAIRSYPYLSHRLIWLMVHGELPVHIDHQDGQRSNNRLENLRNVTPSVNHKNVRRKSTNTSGVTGVRMETRTGKWHAYIRVDYARKNLGRYDSIDAAVAARKLAESQYGFHPNHGRA